MERLTEKVRNFDGTAISKKSLIDRAGKGYPSSYASDIVTKLAEYEDLEEQGLLLRLPCKVGDTAYCIEDKKIWDCIVDKVTISRTNGVWFEVKTPKSMPDISAIEYTENAFGETVFLTQAEAEQKLKEMEGIKC